MIGWRNRVRSIVDMYRVEISRLGGKVNRGFSGLGRLLSALTTQIGLKLEGDTDMSPDKKMCQEIWQAHQEWSNSITNFNFISEPDLIDYSVYDIETKQKKYMYLLKMAREQNISDSSLRRICG